MNGNIVRAGVMGYLDGTVSISGVVIAVASSGADFKTTLVAGLGAMVAGALSMAGAEYASVSSQRAHDPSVVPWQAAVASLVTFAAASLIPLVTVSFGVVWCILASLVSLAVFGYVEGKARSAVRITLIGALTMMATLFLGSVVG
jgi:vacuolar iron transporter family protein